MSSTSLTPSPAPIVPPRSALRKPSQVFIEKTDSPSRPLVQERGSSLYVLDVDAPLEPSRSLSSDSGYEETDATSRISASMARRSTIPAEAKEHGVFGRKRIGTDRDPHKVRDGLGPKESPSGVYTRKLGISHWISELTGSTHIPWCMWSSSIPISYSRIYTDQFPTIPRSS